MDFSALIGDWLAPVGNLSVVGVLIASWRMFFIEMRKDRDYWRSMALRGTVLAERAIGPGKDDA